MDRRRAAGALLALAACIACSTAAPTASNQTALELLEGPTEGCYYNFQHYGEGDRIMTNEPCLNCTCHNRMLMCYLRVCPFTKPIGQDCTIEKRADQCCPIVTCPDVPVDLLTSTSTSSPAEYGATGLGKVDKYGCSINGKYFSEGSKVPPTPNKPCEHCYCIRNMTTCVMQECTLHVDGCTPIYHKDVCCPVRYSCDHEEDEMLLLDDMTTTVRPTPGFLLTTTTMPAVTQLSQDCVHDDQIFADGALIKTEKACEHCYCMKGDIVCVVQECGTPMENEGKNCTSLPPRQGQCCPDTYICEGDELITDVTTEKVFEDITTLSPPRRTEGSGYRNEPDEPYTDMPTFEGSGEEQATTLDMSGTYTSQKQTPEIIDEVFAPTEESVKPSQSTVEPDKGQNTVPDEFEESTSDAHLHGTTIQSQELLTTTQPTVVDEIKETEVLVSKTTTSEPMESDIISKEDELIMTTKPASNADIEGIKTPTVNPEMESETTSFDKIDKMTTPRVLETSDYESSTLHEQQDKSTTSQFMDLSEQDETLQPKLPTTLAPKDKFEEPEKDISATPEYTEDIVTTTSSRTEAFETTSINPVENEIHEDISPILTPGRIPGEGDCLLNGITYKNNTNVPNINNCHSSCKCVSSIVKCDPIICSPPPEHMDNMNDCQPIYDTPDACCPTYVCHSRETIPPESHSQMSGTESPKPSPEKSESECHGDDCKAGEIPPTSPESCESGNCKSDTEVPIKCENGACTEHTDTSSNASPPLEHPETCIGDSCLPSKDSCIDGNCEQPATSEHICNNENGCQPSEAEPCEGNNCGEKSEVTAHKDEICQDPEGCKTSAAPEVPVPACEGAECGNGVSEEGTSHTECTEENCKPKEYTPEEHKAPSECSGADCITQGKDESNVLTTESILGDQSSKDSTTEVTEQHDSKLPESEDGSKITTQTIEDITEKQDASPALSTERSEIVTTSDEADHITENAELFTTESHITEVEESVTEKYEKPESEDHKTYTTKVAEQTTESFINVDKDISTDTPTVMQQEEHSTVLPKEDVDIVPEKVTESSPSSVLETSTELSDMEEHDLNKHKEDTTDNMEEITQKYEAQTEPSIILETTSKESEVSVSEEAYTDKQEIYTEAPEDHVTNLNEIMPLNTEKQEPAQSPNEENEITESGLRTTTTQPATPTVHGIPTDQEDVKHTEMSNVESTETSESFTTQQSVPLEQSSESGITKLEETETGTTNDYTQKEQSYTEHPDINIEKLPEPYATEKESLYPQTTHIPQESVEEEIKTTEPSIENEQEFTHPPKTIETLPDEQSAYTTPKGTEEQEISVLDIHTTPSATDENLETLHPMTESSETKLSETPVKEEDATAVSEDFKDSSTRYPESVTDLQETTSKTVDEVKIPSETFEGPTEVPESTKIPETLFPEDTTHKEYLPPIVTETDTDDLPSKPTVEEETSGIETTISSVLSDVSQSAETEIVSDSKGESTLKPEIISTNTDEPIYVPEKPEKEIPATERVESEIATTESLRQPAEGMADKEETTETLIAPTTEELTDLDIKIHSTQEEESVPVTVVETKTEETPLSTPSGTYVTEQQIPEKQETILPDQHVTDSGEKIQTPTDISDSNESVTPNINTDAPEIITQSQDTETKLDEIFTTSTHTIKENEEHTESSMSLVTEKHIPGDTASDSEIDKTTDATHMIIPETHETKTDKPYSEDTEKPIVMETEPEQSPVELPVSTISEKEHGSDIPSQTHDVKESLPEGLSTPEYTTSKISDIHGEEMTSSPITDEVKLVTSADTDEKLAPTTEYKEGTTYEPTPSKMDSEISVDKTHETSTASSDSSSSEESVTIGEQEISTKSPEGPYMTTAIYDHEPEIIPHDKPAMENPPVDVTKETEDDSKSTSVPKIQEPSEDHTSVTVGDLQEPELEMKVTAAPTEQEDKYTTVPDLFTAKYPEPLDKEQETETPEKKPIKPEDTTLVPNEPITTEGIMYTKQPISSDVHSTVAVDYEKQTEIPTHSDTEKDILTPTYQDLTTTKEELMFNVPEAHSTESSDTAITDQDNRRTLSPDEYIKPEQSTEKHELPAAEEVTTALPESVKTPEEEQSIIIPEISTNVPEKESVTSESAHTLPEAEYVTPISQVTEVETMYTESEVSDKDHETPAVTEIVAEHTEAVPDITEKPSYIKPIDSENVQTELPAFDVTEKDEIEKTTGHEDIVKTPEEIPEQHTVATDSETETSTQNISGETEMSVFKETELSSPKVTEGPLAEATDAIITEAPESTVEQLSKVTVPQDAEIEHEITETTPEVSLIPVQDVTEAEVLKVTKTPEHDVTESSVPEVTDTSVPEVPKTSVPQTSEEVVPEETTVGVPVATEKVISEITETSVPDKTKTSVPYATETSIPKETEGSVPEPTEATDTKATDTALPEVLEPLIPKVTEGSVPEVTEESIGEVTEVSVPKETEAVSIPESSTHEPIDEIYKPPAEPLSTSEPAYSPSETTPYLVELEEHSFGQDTSVAPEDTYTTRGPESEQTERGDQPLDIVTDKSTQEDIHKQYTTSQPHAEKDETLSTPSQDQPSEYLTTISAEEGIPPKTELTTEKTMVPSELPEPTLPNVQPEENIQAIEAQGSTLPPTDSETLSEHEKLTTNLIIETTTDKVYSPSDSEKVADQEPIHETPAIEDELIPTITKATTVKSPEETTSSPIVDEKITKPEEKPVEPYPTTAPELPKPGLSEIQPTEEVSSPDFPPGGTTGYGQEPDYAEEDQAFGPGTCRYGGKVYVSAQQIPRDDPCDFCFCFRSDIICLQQSCPPPIHGCHEEPIQGFCCPRYECPVSMATTLNVTTTTTTTTTTLPPHFFPHAYKGAAQRRGCQIKGHTYKVGEVVRASSGPCLHCTCGGDGQMKCDPKACTPEPMLRQMIAAAVSAKRRR